MILSSCDNIDVLESTIDGKNTFHATQMVLWQLKYHQIDEQESATEEQHTIGRDAVLDHRKLKILHEIDQAQLPKGKKPSTSFKAGDVIPETWFRSENQLKASQKNMAWAVAHKKQVNFGLFIMKQYVQRIPQ